jgi:hypothetical protein
MFFDKNFKAEKSGEAETKQIFEKKKRRLHSKIPELVALILLQEKKCIN